MEQFKADVESQKFLNDQEVTVKLDETKILSQVNAAEYVNLSSILGVSDLVQLRCDLLCGRVGSLWAYCAFNLNRLLDTVR